MSMFEVDGADDDDPPDERDQPAKFSTDEWETLDSGPPPTGFYPIARPPEDDEDPDFDPYE